MGACFCPTFNAAVVEKLKAVRAPTGLIISGRGCTHRFNAHWETHIANCGGFDIVHGGEFDGFEPRDEMIMKDLLNRHMLRCEKITYVVCSISDKCRRKMSDPQTMGPMTTDAYLQKMWKAMVQEESNDMYTVQSVHANDSMQYFVMEIIDRIVYIIRYKQNGFDHLNGLFSLWENHYVMYISYSI